MKKFLITLCFLISTLVSFACHYSYLTLNSGPTSIGGGLYSTDVTVCIGQKQNWGATYGFTLCFDVPISSASGPNFPTVTNTYNICGGPCGPTQSVTASATGTIAGNCITYNTTTSTPAGYPLVSDRYDGGAGAAGNSNSFCFTITIVTNGYPGSLALAGNVEAEPGVSGNDGNHTPCNGNGYEPDMTILFTALPIELVDFDGQNKDNINHLWWVTATETNNDYFTLERSRGGEFWEIIDTEAGASNSSTPILYEYLDYGYMDGTNYYRLTQTDFNGASETFQIIAINTTVPPKREIPIAYDTLGRIIKDPDNYIGVIIFKYKNGSWYKISRLK